ncbi:hypothetical protein IV02_26565 [Pseudomonas syringae]|uniref:Uncharacterized protein n=1 Tax=Pseudomonas syringae TaxID=317 RepID=A0A085US12_PSESX|nr:hypothetical protein IV02_26565 [Pseudomonas syringae]
MISTLDHKVQILPLTSFSGSPADFKKYVIRPGGIINGNRIAPIAFGRRFPDLRLGVLKAFNQSWKFVGQSIPSLAEGARSRCPLIDDGLALAVAGVVIGSAETVSRERDVDTQIAFRQLTSYNESEGFKV